MPSIAATIRRFQTGQADAAARPSSDRLRPLPSFGSNPGALDGWYHAPEGVADMPLVVVLHGCTQTAAGYDHGSGWSDLAGRFGFAVLFPEQRRANNPNLCFNWFLEEDTRRDGGEALSIRQMIETVVARHPIDPDRIFVTGLSAGGAMTGVMLATYPELFAGGGIVAGLPFGAATNVSTALALMQGRGHAPAGIAAAAIRAASPHRGPWPRITVWHGDADRTVDVANADAILGQWRLVHGTADAPDVSDLVDGQRHRAWFGRDGAIAVEDYRIAGLGHGTPLATSGAEGCGHAGAYMIEAGISSTWRQAQRWGVAPASSATAIAPATGTKVESTRVRSALTSEPTAATAGAAATIDRALRLAGLLR